MNPAIEKALEAKAQFSKSVADDVDEGWQMVYYRQYKTAWELAVNAVRNEANDKFPMQSQRTEANRYYVNRMNELGLPQKL